MVVRKSIFKWFISKKRFLVVVLLVGFIDYATDSVFLFMFIINCGKKDLEVSPQSDGSGRSWSEVLKMVKAPKHQEV